MPLTEEEAKRRERKRKRIWQAAYYKANKDEVSKKNKIYRDANKEKAAAYHKVYRKANKDRLAKTEKAYRDANKEKSAAYAKKYRIENREYIAVRDKNYREANKEKIRLYEKSRQAHRQVTDKARYARLDDSMVRKVICTHSPLTASDIPQSLIVAKRLELQMKRYFKETENG
jgi:hypothetical protein